MQKFVGKNILILGLGRSGRAVISALSRLKSNIFYYDDNREKTKKLASSLSKLHTPIYELNKKTINDIDLVIISPGVSIYNENVKLLKKFNKKIIGEIELFYQISKIKPIAVTGSNGKTTTVSFLYHILKFADIKCELLGNIGTPLVSVFGKNNYKNVIAEISSFQLESISTFHPKISAITNITPNHLDRHKSFKNYTSEKFKIFANQTKRDYCVLNFDDKVLSQATPKSKVLYFSLKSIVKGAFILDDYFCCKFHKKIEKIAPVSSSKLIGKHNLQNMLCAIVIAKIMKVNNRIIKKAIETFEPIIHRIQFVDEKNGIKFYNDSKSTSPDATNIALNCFEKNIHLIMGGKDKNCKFDSIFDKGKNKVVEYLFVGENRKKLIESAVRKKVENYRVFNTIADATNFAYNHSQIGDTILLSPASASFDAYSSFEERGDDFIKIVGELK